MQGHDNCNSNCMRGEGGASAMAKAVKALEGPSPPLFPGSLACRHLSPNSVCPITLLATALRTAPCVGIGSLVGGQTVSQPPPHSPGGGTAALWGHQGLCSPTRPWGVRMHQQQAVCPMWPGHQAPPKLNLLGVAPYPMWLGHQPQPQP